MDSIGRHGIGLLGIERRTRKGFIPWIDARGLFASFSSARLGRMFQDVDRTLPADTPGQTVASWVAANSPLIRLEQATEADRMTLVQVGNRLGLQSDGLGDSIFFNTSGVGAGMGAVARNVTAMTIYLVVQPFNLPPSATNWFLIGNNASFSRLTVTYGTTNIPYTQIRRLDAGTNWNTSTELDVVTQFAPTVFTLRMNYATGVRDWFENGQLITGKSIDGTGIIGDGATSNTDSQLVRFGSAKSTYFDWELCQALHTNDEVDEMAEALLELYS